MTEWIVFLIGSIVAAIGSGAFFYQRGRKDSSTAEALAKAQREWAAKEDLKGINKERISHEARVRQQTELLQRAKALERQEILDGKTRDIRELERDVQDLETGLKKEGDE